MFDHEYSDLRKRLLQAQQGQVLPFTMEIVFIVFYLHQITHKKILICLIFPHFSAIFAQITIFGNAQKPHQQYPNIVSNSPHCVCYFSSFSDYICMDYYI